jgi:DNA invertase Pin-like site-specific DNA recombinase
MPPKSSRRFPQPPKKTASLYKRLSLTPDEKSTSLESQETDMRRLAADLGLRIVAIHTDIESGASRTRSGLQDWLDDARKGRVDHLLAWHFDRVERGGLAAIGAFLDTVKGIDAQGRSSHHPPRFLSVNDGLDSTDSNFDLNIGIKAIIAQEERRRISERVSRSKQALRDMQRFGGGVPPFGWTSVPNPVVDDKGNPIGRVLAPVEEEQEALRAAADVLVKDGLKAAAKYLNQQTNLKPRRAKAFTRQTLMQTFVTEASDKIFTPVERVQIREALKPKEERKSHGRAATRLLAGGILRCAGCDRPMYVATRAVRRKDPDAQPIKHYRCRSGLDGYPCDKKVSASARLVEAAVEEAWLAGWGPKERLEVVSQVTEHHQQLALMTEEIDALSERLAHVRGVDRRQLVDQIEALEARQAELEATQPGTSWRDQTTRSLGTYADLYLAADLEGRRKLLKMTISGGLHLEPATRQRIRVFDMERIPDRWKLDPDNYIGDVRDYPEFQQLPPEDIDETWEPDEETWEPDEDEANN